MSICVYQSSDKFLHLHIKSALMKWTNWNFLYYTSILKLTTSRSRGGQKDNDNLLIVNDDEFLIPETRLGLVGEILFLYLLFFSFSKALTLVDLKVPSSIVYCRAPVGKRTRLFCESYYTWHWMTWDESAFYPSHITNHW